MCICICHHANMCIYMWYITKKQYVYIHIYIYVCVYIYLYSCN